jgi:hypothetical protein
MADKDFKHKDIWNEYKNIDEYIKHTFTDCKYGLGQLESMEDEIGKLKLVVSKLTKILYNTDLLTKEEVIEILDA